MTTTTTTPAIEAAKAAGFICLVYIEGGCEAGEFLIHPDTDLDDRFKAFGIDWDQWVWVNGWNVSIDRID